MCSKHCFGPDTTIRMAWECRGFMYFVNVCSAEALQVARGLWLTGADYVSLYDSAGNGWRYSPSRGAYRGSQMGGYDS